MTRITPSPTAPRARILIVEDETLIALELEEMLAELGYEVAGTAGSHAQAMALCAQAPHPDLALMDINIRGDIDGIETARLIRDRFAIPSVFLTAYSDPSTLARATESGALGYLLKPFSGRDLVAAIEIALVKDTSDRQLQAYRTQLEHKVAELERALAEIRELRQLLPVCAWCKNVRKDDGYWEEITAYLQQHTDIVLTHGICPSCAESIFPQ